MDQTTKRRPLLIGSLVTVPTRRVALLAILIAMLSGAVFGAWSLIGPMKVFRPLVAADGWTISGKFSPDKGIAADLQIPMAMSLDPAFRYWQTWGGDPAQLDGTVTSAPFLSPPYLAVPYGGFPAENPGNRVVLRCDSTGRELPVSRFRMPEPRATSYVAIPQGFCAGDVRLVASVSGEPFLAVGTPFEISAARYYAETGTFSRAMVVIGTWALIVLIWFVSVFIADRVFPKSDRLAMGMIGLAIVGMAFLMLFTVAAEVGTLTSNLLFIIATILSFLIHFKFRDFSSSVFKEFRISLFAWLAFALFCAAVVTAADNGGGSWWINAIFTPLRWSSDNQIPYTFAEAVLNGTTPSEIHWGPWIPTDRTPLLSGLLLPIRAILINPMARTIGSTFIPTAYMMSCIVILSMWVFIVIGIVRRLDRSAVAVVLLIMMTSPFLFFNSVYVWPKILGASYVLISFWLLFAMSRARARDPIGIGIVALSAAAAYLAHSSNLLALVPIAVLFMPTILRQGVWSIFVSCIAAIMLAGPWFYWQLMLVPGGNALMRFALAFDYETANRARSVGSAVLDAYSVMRFDDWLQGKLATVALILGLAEPNFALQELAKNSPGTGILGTARVLDFFSVRHALGIAGLGILLVPFLGWFRKDSEAVSLARLASVAGIGGVLLALLVTLPPGIVHHQAYGALLLIVLGGALAIALVPRWIGWLGALISLSYFAVVWVWHPISTAITVHPSAIYFMVICVAWMVLLLWERPPVQAGASFS